MTLTIQEISDRIEINDLLIRYCTAVDRHDWDAFDEIFTANCLIDYSASPIHTLKVNLDPAKTNNLLFNPRPRPALYSRAADPTRRLRQPGTILGNGSKDRKI